MFNQSRQEALKAMDSNLQGLSAEKARERQERYGPNALKEAKRKSVFEVFLEQFCDLLVVILIAAAAISALTGGLEGSAVIVTVIILNAILGTVQHFKAEQSLKSLQEMSAPAAHVLRDGIKVRIPAHEVVPGDILLVEAGDVVAADGRILDNFSLKVNESALTGESLSVEKTSETLEGENIPLGDQKNMVFSGSLVTYGRATVLVTGIGMKTELGKIADLMNATQQKRTPLQVSLDDFSRKLSVLILGVCAVVFCLGIWRNMPWIDSLMFAVALAVAAIPEALSSIVTIALAIGTQKMVKQNAIIKNLRAVEGLGCVSVICSDKTGTLTQNRMTVQHLYVDGRRIDGADAEKTDGMTQKILLASVLCNDGVLSGDTAIGDPTETALLSYYRLLGGEEAAVKNDYPRLGEIPFDSDRKLMSTLHKLNGQTVLLTKGALDVALDRCTHILTADGAREITPQDREQIEQANLDFSQEGLRVLAFCMKKREGESPLALAEENGLAFLGLISMMDPPREESAQAVKNCIRAGIRPVMITGDHRITATAIARKIGLFRQGDIALTGTELDKLSDEALQERIEKISVYARVSPEHKIRIVNAWQEKGKIVAMTGDGVNDAPALKKADIGIAMGITGTEVSKDAASVILTDDNFATIVSAVANGRNVYQNIKNSIKFLLSGNMSGIFAVLYTSLLGLPLPFTAVHLLFINLLTDSLPAIAINMERPTGDLLKEKPRSPKESILTRDLLRDMAVQGGLIAVFTMIAFYSGIRTDAALASTMAFATLCAARLFHGFNCRGKRSIFRLGLFTNPYSIGAFTIGLFLLTGVLMIPGLHGLFEISNAFGGKELLFVLLCAAAPTALLQLWRVVRELIEKKGRDKT